jgi:predicted ferric reductase
MLTRASLWIAVYLALVTMPLGLLLVVGAPRGGGFWWDFAMAVGYSGLAMMGIQFALTARFKHMAAPFGIDIIYYFHRYLAAVAFLLLLAHAALLGGLYPEAIDTVDPRRAPGYMTLGWIAMAAFTLVMLTSLWRRALGIEYDRWRRWHVLLALIGMLAAAAHVLGSGSYLQSPLKRALWVALALSWLGLVVWVRMLRPWRLLRQPWRVVASQHEPGRSWTLTLKPVSGAPFPYHAGQFAWVSLRASPFAMREHPFSFSSTPTQAGSVAFTIKELGDFTATIGSIAVGETAYVDGPYGAFHLDRFATAKGFVFIAGGASAAHCR